MSTLAEMQALWDSQPWHVKRRVRIKVWWWFQQAKWQWRWQRANAVLNFREAVPDGDRRWSPSWRQRIRWSLGRFWEDEA